MTKRKILTPVDFGETATLAVRAASRMAKRLDAELIALYADSFLPPVAYADIPVAWYSENIEELKAGAAQRLEAFVNEHVDSGVVVERRIVADTPVHAILAIASSEPVDMIVMGTHGRSGWKRALLGSITESVLHETNVPMLTIRHNEADPLVVRPDIKRVLCPVNFSEVARDALAKAVEIGDAFDAEIHVVHVAESSGRGENGNGIDDLNDWIPAEFRDRCCYKEQIMRGHAAEQVIDLARKIAADLIVMGAQHRRFVDSTVIGTTTDRIVRHAYCPVLTVIRPVGSPTEQAVAAAVASED